MGRRRYELDTRILTVFFLVAMPFVAFGSFLIVGMARGSLQDTVGASLEQRAAQTRLLIERYIADQIVYLRLLAQEPELHEALRASTRDTRSDDATRLERAASSRLAERLREAALIRSGVLVIHAVDATGRMAATSGRMGPVQKAETTWFRALARAEAPVPHVEDIHRRADGTAVFEIAYPVYDDQGQWLGAVHALMDATDLYAVLAPVRIGRTGHADLIRSSDGLVLASDNTELELSRVYPGFAAIQAAQRERRGFWLVPESEETLEDGTVRTEPRRLLGYSLIDQVPNVEWCVVVEQDLDEANAPIDLVTRYLLIHFLGVFGTVILLALYFSFKLEAPVIEEELHLHEEHLPKGVRVETED
jgi:hypothetical protein